MTPPSPNLRRLRDFVGDFGALMATAPDEAAILSQGAGLLGGLVRQDDWLPDACAEADPQHYRQYLLHLDPQRRFSVVAFVWGPGQATPVHDHTVWGLVGVLRGAELSQAHAFVQDRLSPVGSRHRLAPGQVEAVSPTVGDIHQVSNAFTDRVSISIHVYGADIGAVRRHAYEVAGGRKTFVSGYSNARAPDLWGATAEADA